MTDRTLTDQQQDLLESLVDSAGLSNVLGGLANICAAKSDHVLTNWQDESLSRRWMAAMMAPLLGMPRNDGDKQCE